MAYEGLEPCQLASASSPSAPRQPPPKVKIRRGEEGRVKSQRKCKKCGTIGHIARKCTNPVDASFGEEEQWAATNGEENATLE